MTNIYVVRTNGSGALMTNDFIVFTDKEKAFNEFTKLCRKFQKQYNLPEEAVNNCLKLNFLDVEEICDFYNLDDGSDDDFCALEEIPLEEWTDNQETSTYFDYEEVDIILQERGL